MTELGRLLAGEIPGLRRYARALVGNRDQADDLVQDCLERAWSRSHLLRSEGELRVWLFTILHNLHVTGLRKRGREPVLVSVTAEHALSPPDQESSVVISDLERALDGLDPDQRSAVLLIGLEDLSYTQAATVLGIPVGTLMSRLHRGRKRLQAALEGHAPIALGRVK
jgi:RNA polymerase sigma factor (sigma-70 family)